MKVRAINLRPFHAQSHICESFGSGRHYAEQKCCTILLIRRTAVQAVAHACVLQAIAVNVSASRKITMQQKARLSQ